MHDFRGVLIGLAVREFDRMRAIWLVFSNCQKVVCQKIRVKLRGFDSKRRYVRHATLISNQYG